MNAHINLDIDYLHMRALNVLQAMIDTAKELKDECTAQNPPSVERFGVRFKVNLARRPIGPRGGTSTERTIKATC
jgi:hypothetical protein